MNPNVLNFEGNSPKEEAKAKLAANPDIMFEELQTIAIRREDADFWKKFASEWGGALYLLDEKNFKQFEREEIDPQAFEFARRTYRLGLITLSALYDKLRAWSDSNPQEDYRLNMNVLECYFLPSYLDDYGRAYAPGKKQGQAYVEAIRQAFGEDGALEQKAEALQALVHEYIERLHVYAKQ
ncbi:hypothetical protein C8Z91_08980 [Paenibacillus elgii]|uniref:Uncharacterized protein n=1 Tax=Paenibacillus elgii TaxID=189691 RepID=A0A2T6G5W8_9BACL|nr:hypothetical protein [Paenibacillus elgii]PUA39550.1 hypothetical protein C8Z91_08980 [Paenibacillus elgii]